MERLCEQLRREPKNMDGPCELVRTTVSCHGLGIRGNLIRLKEWYIYIYTVFTNVILPIFFKVQFLLHFILRFLRYQSPEFYPLRSGWWVGTSASKVVSIFPEILVEHGVGHEVGRLERDARLQWSFRGCAKVVKCLQCKLSMNLF